MLGHLIRKEVLDHLLSLRFLILSALGALVIWLSLYDGYAYYQGCLKDYRLAQATTEERVRELVMGPHQEVWDNWREVGAFGYLNHKPPTPMSIFVRGQDQTLPRSIASARARRMNRSPAAVEPVMELFLPMDLGLIVQTVLSLFVLLLTYDAVCGEKEAGTLRLIASFPAPRHQLLLGKLLGTLIPTLATVGIPLLLGIGVVFLLPDVGVDGSALARLWLILVAFGLYLAAFFCLGLFVSCMTHRPATSFVILMAIWVGAVIVLPRLSLIVADGVRPASSVQELQTEKAMISSQAQAQRDVLGNQWTREHSRLGQEWLRSPEGQEAYQIYNNKVATDAYEATQVGSKRLEEAFQNRFNARLDLAVDLARFTPAFAVNHATVRLAGTGEDRHRRFESDYARHKERHSAWILKKDLVFRLELARPEKFGKPRWDISDIPRFIYREAWPKEDVQAALTDLGMLVLWGLTFFAGAYVALLRYDFR